MMALGLMFLVSCCPLVAPLLCEDSWVSWNLTYKTAMGFSVTAMTCFCLRLSKHSETCEFIFGKRLNTCYKHVHLARETMNPRDIMTDAIHNFHPQVCTILL